MIKVCRLLALRVRLRAFLFILLGFPIENVDTDIFFLTDFEFLDAGPPGFSVGIA